jgi:hypothetical protein
MSRASIIVLLSAVILLLFVLELVRSRRLREEYAWLWLLSAGVYLLVTVRSNLGSWLNNLFGAQDGSSVFVFMGLYFLILISIQYSIRLSRLTTQNKDLAQQLAILDSEIRRLSAEIGRAGAGDGVGEGRGRAGGREALAQQVAELEKQPGELTLGEGDKERAVPAVQEGTRAERLDR